jgi:molybdenum cofactor biosynthesis protein B
VSVHEHRAHAPARLDVAVITVSDTRTGATDESGALVRKLLEERGHRVASVAVVRDERDEIAAALRTALAGAAQAVVLNGGTGVSPRDVTIETVEPMLDKALPGFGELFRHLSFREIGSAAMLTRATAGIAAGKPVFALPGSPAAVMLAMERLVLPELGHVAGEAVKGSGKPGDPLRKA